MMKSHHNYWYCILAFLLPMGAAAQENLKIKDTGGTVLMEVRPDGVLIRKMTTVERTAVPGLMPADNGLMVYDTDTKSLWLWHDTQWVEVDGVDLVDDADHDPANELQDWNSLPGKPAGFADGADDVNDADPDPTNELQNWSNLPGMPAGFSDGVDHVDDADHDPLNEKNTALIRNGTQLELSDIGGTLSANIGWAIGTGKVFNTADNAGIGTSSPLAKLHVQNGAVLFNGTTGATPVSGAGPRMMWVPAKYAFRAGIVNATQWDDSNIGPRSFVGGGTDNLASAWNSIVAGGGQGSATADGSFVGGGFNNAASGINASVNGGESNTASGNYSFIGAGFTNTASGQRSFVAGGTNNIASGWSSMVAGGSLNSATTDGSFIGGGNGNTASGGNSFIGGGLNNIASGYASFASGRESIASGNHAFAGGHGLLAKSFNETVFGTWNKDYTPASATGFVNTDRLFVIGNGTATNTRSNAMTILKDGRVGIGTDLPKTGLHVVGNKDSSDHIMLIENLNPEGNGLRIKINGNHPLWVELTDTSGFFVPTLGVPAALSNIFEPTAAAIKNYLLSGTPLGLSSFNFNNVFAPGSILDDMGIDDLVAGGVCKGAETLVNFVNGIGLESITLPDLPLDNIPQDIGDIPLLPAIPSLPASVNIPIPNFQLWIPCPVCDYLTITTPDPTFNLNFINTPITTFNTGISTVNTGVTNANTILENGYDNLKSGLQTIDHLEIPLPQLQMPASIGPLTCPNPNPFDNFSFSFDAWNEEYGFVDPISKDNEFITFVDKGNRKLGAVTGKSFGSFAQDYFKKEKVLEIGSHVVGLLSDDGSMASNVFKLAKDVFDFIKESNKIGVSYESGFGDYAEWLERENHVEHIGYGDIVGIRGGKISLSLENAEQVMVVSKAPIVRGNAPDPNHEMNGNDVAFIGQVPVKVMGPVQTGDFIVANPATPGYGIAVAANEITPDQMALAVGKSWETNLAPGFKFVNTIVGMHNNGWAAPVRKLQERLDTQDAAIQSLTARLDMLENGSSLASKSGKRDQR